MQTVLDECYKKGIYVIIDMHQDLFGDYQNKQVGNGAPHWATLTDGKSYRKPLLIWAEGYFFRSAVHNAFDNFWNNTLIDGKGVQDRFCDLWRVVNKRFGNHPAVIGFDFFNEPFPGSDGGKVFRLVVGNAVKTILRDGRVDRKKIFSSLTKKNFIKIFLDEFEGDVFRDISKPADDIIKRFDTERYYPFIQKLTEAVRRENTDKIIFMENSYYSNLGIPFSAPAIEVNSIRDRNQAFAPHAYDFMVDSPIYKYANNSRVEMIFNQRRKEQLESLKAPVLVGEWGGGYSKNTDWISHVEFLFDLFDSYKWSNTYWAFSTENIKSEVRDMLTRPYAYAVCGDIETTRYDKENNAYYLSFTQKDDFDAPTEIMCHRKPVSVKTNGEYTVKREYCNIYKVFVKTSKGENYVKIDF